MITSPKFDRALQKWWLEDDISFREVLFFVGYIKLQECIILLDCPPPVLVIMPWHILTMPLSYEFVSSLHFGMAQA